MKICRFTFKKEGEYDVKVMFVSSECSPFAASGGLGDVIGALPKAIRKEDDRIEVSVIMPYYDSVREKYSEEVHYTCDLSFRLSWRNTGATVYETHRDGVKYFFIENHRYFDRGRLYGEYDDAERFAFFSVAVIEFMLQSGNFPDVLHANDWQSALSIVYLKTLYKNIYQLSSIRTLFTVHNIEYQGIFTPLIKEDVLGLGEEFNGILEYNGAVNFMKGALTVSDFISTVSPNYKNELRYDFFAFGLAPVINSVFHKITGIINGIDYDYFSPEKDSDLYFNYSKNNLSEGKAKNKEAFQTEYGLKVSGDVPLIAMITRLTAGKGIELVLHILEELLSHNRVQVAILGTGEEKYEAELNRLSDKYENLVSIIKFDRAVSKKLYAAADIFLMPSKSEPCGLAQMIACAYGTVPVVRSIGGLYDSIEAWDGKEGNGFRFDNFNAHEMLYVIKSAIELYNGDNWEKLRNNAIKSRFEWSRSAKEYISVYKNLLKW